MTSVAGIELESHLSSPLQGLNPPQREAAETVNGPLLVLAGAGTGKTRVLIARMAHIIQQRHAYPSQILAVTFTNKAAREMTHRLSRWVPTEGLWLGTFHSVAARILRRHAELLDLPPHFTIIDTDDQLRLLKPLIAQHNLDEKKYPPRLFLNIIQRWKDVGLTPERITASDIKDYHYRIAQTIYQDYQAKLTSLGAVDFGDLLLHSIAIFTKHPDILLEYHHKFKYILVDEYQDTNIAQYLWLRLLAQGHKNICCVGDDDQSIYGWRGAEIGNILKFEQDFPASKVIRLEQNYRSTSHILGAASHVISNNAGRLGKTLWTENEDGEKVKIHAVWDEREEARFIASEIEHLQREHRLPLSSIAILVRASFQTRAFEECFITQAIPYRVIGGLRFYERQEIRDVIAYLRLIANMSDDLAFERIINVPKRGIGDSTLQLLRETTQTYHCSYVQAIRLQLERDAFKGKAKTSLAQFITHLERWQGLMTALGPKGLAEVVIHESGYLAMWQADKTVEAEGRIENIKELLQALNDFNSLPEFLEHVSLVMEREGNEQEEMVNIMTLHAAKGLEFNTVFLPGWEEGIFPHQKSLEEKGDQGLEEERRLAYVGITRARERLYITHAANRRMYNQWLNTIASRFIKELPSDHCDHNQLAGFQQSTASHYNARQEHYTYPEKVVSTPHVYHGSAFRLGQQVQHATFGQGVVIGINGDHLDIQFQQSGRKKLIDRFVKPLKG